MWRRPQRNSSGREALNEALIWELVEKGGRTEKGEEGEASRCLYRGEEEATVRRFSVLARDDAGKGREKRDGFEQRRAALSLSLSHNRGERSQSVGWI